MYCRRDPSGRGRPAVVRAGRSLPRRPPSSAGGRAMSYNMTYARKSGAGARTAESRRLRRWFWRRRRGRLGHAAGISNIIGHARPRLLGRPCGGRGCGALFGCGALPVVPFPPACPSCALCFVRRRETASPRLGRGRTLAAGAPAIVCGSAFCTWAAPLSAARSRRFTRCRS